MVNNKTYFVGIFWFIASIVISCMNDVISKYTGSNMHGAQISFFRYFFGLISLIPVILMSSKDSLKTSNISIQIVRGILLFFGISGWTYAITITKLANVTVMSFTIPLFTLLLGIFFLSEKIHWYRWVATIVGFIGIFIIISPSSLNIDKGIIIMLFSAIAFASLDIINKKFIVKETMLAMMLYSAIITTLLSLPMAIKYWQPVACHELLLMLILGIGSNLILYCLLKSFAIVDATAVAPYRYLELIISFSVGYLLFQEVPPQTTWLGACFIIPATLFIAYSETKK